MLCVVFFFFLQSLFEPMDFDSTPQKNCNLVILRTNCSPSGKRLVWQLSLIYPKKWDAEPAQRFKLGRRNGENESPLRGGWLALFIDNRCFNCNMPRMTTCSRDIELLAVGLCSYCMPKRDFACHCCLHLHPPLSASGRWCHPLGYYETANRAPWGLHVCQWGL